jgi:hypothetical protein
MYFDPLMSFRAPGVLAASDLTLIMALSAKDIVAISERSV